MPFVNLKDEASQSLTTDRFSFSILIFCILSILAQVSLILVSWGKLPPELPLFYSRPWGEAILASPLFLWILPTVAALLTIANFSIAIFWLRTNYFLTRVLIIFAALVAFATLYDSAKIISLLT